MFVLVPHSDLLRIQLETMVLHPSNYYTHIYNTVEHADNVDILTYTLAMSPAIAQT
jgi:hypothetical protein